MITANLAGVPADSELEPEHYIDRQTGRVVEPRSLCRACTTCLGGKTWYSPRSPSGPPLA